ncbi:MAG: M48 family metallopeptidase [Bacteroidetes bacterium]|nr:M48 family metallopeptidase [Bacteroidota bacterium]
MNLKIITAITITLILISCSKVPVTNRRQINMLPESMLMGMSLTNYKDFLSKNTVINNTSDAQLVKKVGNNIAGAVNTYLIEVGKSKRIKNYKWTFNLVKDKTVNAWCMPGGKVVVYSGLMPVAKDETGLAVVMGHEIAHAIARHGNERMSQMLLVQMGGIGLSVAMSEKPEKTQAIFQTAYGVGAVAGMMLPFSRKHEAEADKMGLVFMALAGYDPSKAVDFWERMAANKSGSIPEFLSTHPSDKTRINKIKAFLPQAMKYYRQFR